MKRLRILTYRPRASRRNYRISVLLPLIKINDNINEEYLTEFRKLWQEQVSGLLYQSNDAIIKLNDKVMCK